MAIALSSDDDEEGTGQPDQAEQAPGADNKLVNEHLHARPLSHFSTQYVLYHMLHLLQGQPRLYTALHASSLMSRKSDQVISWSRTRRKNTTAPSYRPDRIHVAPDGVVLLIQALTTADPLWARLLGSLAAGSPEAAQLLQQSLSAEALSTTGAQAMPSSIVSALTKLLRGSPSSAMRSLIWQSLRMLLKQLEREGPASQASPNKVGIPSPCQKRMHNMG